MAKKKNRKKELKRQQKLNIKVISEEGAAWTEALAHKPVFVERRRIQNFDEQHTAIIQYADEHGDYPDVQEISHQLRNGTFIWNPDHELFRKAMHTPNKYKRNNLLKQVLELNPDYFAAEFHLFASEVEDFDLPTFEKVLEFEALVLSKWKTNRYNDWNYFESRPVLTALLFLIEYYMGEGCYHKALELVDLYLSKRPERFPPNFVFCMLSLYHMTGQEIKVERFYQEALNKGKCDDTVLVHAVIAAFLRGKLEEARKLFAKLAEMNTEAIAFFAAKDWYFQVFEIEEQEFYYPNSNESLMASLYPLFDFLEKNIILTEFLSNEAKKLGGKEHITIPYGLEEGLAELADLFSLMGEPEMKGIRMDYARIFLDNGISTSADFKDWTEKEVLALKGIGPVTVKKLKENGIKFNKAN
ncbi:hypothetical protein STRDD11_02029 [Streptococcus sp. DD11]|uniref:helix-hairpin-helix domain-containing protein n=1 Tax=Streptococcus sp. DD11 TaxID=1777879 RepID=UPI00079CBD8C|nr:helix-hairpin-helix domain-containing protein [Streptococcus sp. DD11]KXT81508.1 hypothetical protein STRDD11_02029 [Streptococcus sp. DD11]